MTDTPTQWFGVSPQLFAGVDIVHEMVPVDLCERGRYQPRKTFVEAELKELAKSIQQTGGNIQPVILRARQDGRYEILGGERRVRASMMAGRETVLAIHGHFSDEQCQIITVVENLQRSDLNPVEEAQGFRTLLDKGMNQKNVAINVGKSRAFVANAVRLLTLTTEVQGMLIDGRLSQGHGKILAGLSNSDIEKGLARKSVREGWSVRKLEAEVQRAKTQKVVKIPKTKDSNIKLFEELVAQQFGAPIAIRPSKKKPGAGVISIAYFSDSELKIIIEKMNAWPNEDLWS